MAAKTAAIRRAKKHYEVVAKKSPPGAGGRFKALSASIAAKGNVRNPKAVTAAIGRAKYGKGGFQKMAAAGK